jgi:uncharacterized membrane protein YbhN (UPF0104 family)
VLRREPRANHYHDILRELHAVPVSAILAAVLFTVCNVLVLGGYEVIGFRYIRNNLTPGPGFR